MFAVDIQSNGCNDYAGYVDVTAGCDGWFKSDVMTTLDAHTSQLTALSDANELEVRRGDTVIQPRGGWQRIDIRKLWQYRDLLWFLTLRDVKVRYKQTALGAMWAVIQPLAMMVVASVFFGRLLGVTDRVSVPYPIFFFSGMVAWTFFASAVNASATSLVANAQMLRKIYFPRLIIPVASIGAPLVDLAVSACVLVCMMIWYDVPLTMQMLWLPVLGGVMVMAVLGVGLTLAALNVVYRDFRYVVPFMIQLWFFVTPVIYPVDIVPEQWQWLLSLNPMGGTIEAFRAAILGTPINFIALASSASVSAMLCVIGMIYFARTERRFADVV